MYIVGIDIEVASHIKQSGGSICYICVRTDIIVNIMD